MNPLEKDLLPAILRTLVNRGDDFHGFARFGGTGRGIAAFLDGGNNFFEVSLVLVEIDRGGIVCSESGFLSLHESVLNFGIFGLFFAEVPHFECFVGEEYRAICSGELDAGRMTVF